MKSIFNFITGTVLTTVVYFLGGLDVALKTLLVFILLDYITGVCEAITKKKLNSIIGAKGIVKNRLLDNSCIVSSVRHNNWRNWCN